MNYLDIQSNRSSEMSRLKLFTYFMGAFLMVYFRAPELFSDPRMWAEEGANYFSYALSNTIWDSIFETYRFGYFNLWANLSTLLASRIVPLEYAPTVTIWLSTFIIMIPAGVIITSKSAFFDSDWKKIVAILLYFLTKPSGETWLTNISSQYYFAVIAFVMLLDDRIGLKKTILFGLTLFIGGLSGVLACTFTPFFALKWIMDKSKAHLILALVLGLASTIQLGVIAKNRKAGSSSLSARAKGVDFAYIVQFLAVKTLYAPVLYFKNDRTQKPAYGRKLIGKIYNYKMTGNPKFKNYVASSFVIVTLIFGLLMYSLGLKKSVLYFAPVFLNIMFVIFTSLHPKWGAIHDLAGQRYALSTILAFSILYLICFAESFKLRPSKMTWIRRGVFGSLICAILITGLHNYRSSFWNLNGRNQASWSEEVAKLRSNSNYRKLEIWPAKWYVRVPRNL